MLILLSLVGCHTVKAATEYGWSTGSRQAIRGAGLTQVEERLPRQREEEQGGSQRREALGTQEKNADLTIRQSFKNLNYFTSTYD